MKYVLTVGLVLGLIRVWLGLTVEPINLSVSEFLQQSFKDIAHIYMGVLGTLAWTSRQVQYPRRERERHLILRNLFWFLCVLEVLVAVVSRMSPDALKTLLTN